MNNENFTFSCYNDNHNFLTNRNTTLKCHKLSLKSTKKILD